MRRTQRQLNLPTQIAADALSGALSAFNKLQCTKGHLDLQTYYRGRTVHVWCKHCGEDNIDMRRPNNGETNKYR